LDSPPQDIETLKQSLPLPIVDINSKGKFTYFKLSKASIWSTLGLKGWWKFGEIQRDPRFQFVFETNDGLSTRTLTYYDKIGYGTLKISLTDKELEDKLESLGVCWIRDKPNFDEFMKVVRKSKASSRRYLAVFLMDQSKTAGIGNYILSEVRTSYDHILPQFICATAFTNIQIRCAGALQKLHLPVGEGRRSR
jgi:formamidopyrimidine-DNA glycosylase